MKKKLLKFRTKKSFSRFLFTTKRYGIFHEIRNENGYTVSMTEKLADDAIHRGFAVIDENASKIETTT